MKNARVFLVEDDEDGREGLKVLLGNEGHEVVLEAAALSGALALIESGKLLDLAVNLAIVDGSLTPGDRSCNDGKAVTASIFSKCPSVRVIGFTGGFEDYGHYIIRKPANPDTVMDLIAGIPETA